MLDIVERVSEMAAYGMKPAADPPQLFLRLHFVNHEVVHGVFKRLKPSIDT